MMKLGKDLHPDDKKYVLSAYVYRFTGDHKPRWANKLMDSGKAYPVHFKDDADWLANSAFYVKKNGRLDHRYGNCTSWPTWPNNPELRRKSPLTIADFLGISVDEEASA